jgi:hypothetical protein
MVILPIRVVHLRTLRLVLLSPIDTHIIISMDIIIILNMSSINNKNILSSKVAL